MPAVSVIMPAFNAGPYLSSAVDSVCAQTYEDWELLIVDDGSTDDTARIADSYALRDSRVRVVHQPNGGISSARNRALAAADPGSVFLAFLDSDDVWYPGALATLVEA